MATRRNATSAYARQFIGALPEVDERPHMGSTAFRVKGKIFAQLSSDERTLLVKMSLDEQSELLAQAPDDVSLPAHWSKYGWTYVRIAATSCESLERLITRSWQLIAPRKLRAILDASTRYH